MHNFELNYMEKKNPFKSKTVWLAILQGIAGVITVILAENPEMMTVGGVLMFKTAIDLALRILTDKPLDL